MRRNQKGFTLIEVMIAISIMAVIGIAAAQVIDAVLRSDRISIEADKRITVLQRTYQIIQRDMMQMTQRSVRINGEKAQEQVMYAGENIIDSEADGIIFTRNGWRNPAQMFPRSNLQAVAYRVVEQKLERLHYLYPDQSAASEPQITPLINNVTALKIEFFYKDEWKTSWANAGRPEGIAFIITSDELGEIRWQFIVPNIDGNNGKKAS